MKKSLLRLAVWLSLSAMLVVKAWIIALAWRWFVVPIGVPAIGWAHAFGLALLWRFTGLLYAPELAREPTPPLEMLRGHGRALLVYSVFLAHFAGAHWLMGLGR